MSGSISTHRTAINVSGEEPDPGRADHASRRASRSPSTTARPMHVDEGRDASPSRSRSTLRRRERPVPGPDQPRAAQGRQQGHDPGRVREEAGRGHAEQHAAARSASRPPRTPPGSTHCTVGVANFSQQSANVSAEQSQQREKGHRPPATRTSARRARVIGSGDGVQWSGTLSPAIPPQVTVDQQHHRHRPGRRLPVADRVRRQPDDPGSATTRSRTSTCRRSSTAASRTAQIGVATERLHRDRRRHRLRTSNFFPQTFPNAARPNNVVAPFWTDTNTTGGTPGNNAIQVNVLGDGDSTWIVVDFQSDQELLERDDAHRRDLDPRIPTAAHPGPASEQLTDLVRHGERRLPATRARRSTGAPRTATARAARTSPPRRPTTREYRPVTDAARPRAARSRSRTTSPRRSAGTYHSIASMTSNRTPGITQVGDDAHGHAVSTTTIGTIRRAASGRPFCLPGLAMRRVRIYD